MQGQNNSPLTALGVQQAKALGKHLSGIEFSAIYSSSSPRALQTAELIRGKRKLDIIQEDDLREINLGSWEGMFYYEIENLYPEQSDHFWKYPEKYIPLDGETYEALKKRIANKIEEIAKKHQGETILIVAHGMAIKTLSPTTSVISEPVSDITSGTFNTIFRKSATSSMEAISSKSSWL
jgi:probable phosphoglycerate mutase